MKKLALKLNGTQLLSKDQMKKISGGYTYCILYPKYGCGDTPLFLDYSEYGSNCEAQTMATLDCIDNSECCLVIDCGCH